MLRVITRDRPTLVAEAIYTERHAVKVVEMLKRIG
jgi:hypothetical protein